MAEFYNPYHWVPVEPLNAAQQFHAAPHSNVTHERYLPGTHSGRLVIRLRTVTPVVVGAERKKPENDFAEVVPYKAGDDYAIPGSSLRGAVGSVIEAASNAPLRVLESRVLSFRRPRERSLSAVGMLLEGPNGLQLQPLALPTLPQARGRAGFEAEPKFRAIFTNPLLKVYIGTTHQQIASPGFRERTSKNRLDLHPKRIKKLVWAGNVVAPDPSLHIAKVNGAEYLVAQEEDAGAPPAQGVLRVLGCFERSIPASKKHELWLPWDPAVQPIDILPEAIENFHELADERTAADERLPFEPRNTPRNSDPSRFGNKLRLKENDIVFFDVDDSGRVCELSFSSIWRGRVEAKVPAFFPATHRPLNPGRNEVSLAEQMLGYVEEDLPEPSTRGARTLASRLRFADAIAAPHPSGVIAGSQIALKILSSPKPPSPALYFRRADGTGGFIKKAGLNPRDHAAQGRKWYLHGRCERDEAPWLLPQDVYEADGDKQASIRKQTAKVRPLLPERSFLFHVDVDNLNNLELGLLLYALEPCAEFHHKIGMGKPLGLGSVKIDVLGWFPVSRETRYSVAGLAQPRYGPATLTQQGAELSSHSQWPPYYDRERASQPASGASVLERAREEFLSSGILSPPIQHALELLGDYRRSPVARDIHYPTVAGQGAGIASEHFKWFQFNEGGFKVNGRTMGPSGQFLEPIDEGTQQLRKLVVLEWV